MPRKYSLFLLDGQTYAYQGEILKYLKNLVSYLKGSESFDKFGDAIFGKGLRQHKYKSG